MKKSFLIFGVLAAVCAVKANALPVGEVLGAHKGEWSRWMACPQDCSFLRNDTGGLVTPYTCVDGGIECAGRVRFYDEYPTQYVTSDVVSDNELEKTVLEKNTKKLDVTSVARAAKVGTQVKSVNMAIPVDVKPQAVEKAAIGEVRSNGPNSWMACPPDCSFYTYPDGAIVCMNHGIECPGNNGGIRYYEGEKPTQYAINDVVSTEETVGVSLQNNESQKKNSEVSVRAAVKPVSQTNKVSLEPVAQGDQDPVEKYKIIWDGYEYTCPCGFVSIDDMPPKCKRGDEDKCKGVVKPVSQDR